jgi:hypothetical protein
VSDEGVMLTEARLELIPGDKRLLQVTLPPNAKFWFAFVNKNGVWPWREQDRLLLPLEQLAISREADAINQFANVTDLRLSTSELVLQCEAGGTPREGTTTSKRMIVDVDTTAVDPESDVLSYNYKVSGGRIIGQGRKVKWDLTGIQPGTYTIDAGVDDGCGDCGARKTESVTVSEPECIIDAECPTIDIRGPSTLTSESTFTVSVMGGAQPSVTYNWSAVGGEIIDGQGTPSVRIKIHTIPGGSVTVKIGGLDPRGNCVDSITKEFQ